MTESVYQRQLMNKIEMLFPGCIIIRNDPQQNPGIPDLLVLLGNTWFMLEVKTSEQARQRPNQEYFVQQFDQMSYATFIYPQNEEQVLSDLQSTFGVIR